MCSVVSGWCNLHCRASNPTTQKRCGKTNTEAYLCQHTYAIAARKWQTLYLKKTYCEWLSSEGSVRVNTANRSNHLFEIVVVYVLLFRHVFVFLTLRGQRWPEGDTFVFSVWTEGQLLDVLALRPFLGRKGSVHCLKKVMPGFSTDWKRRLGSFKSEKYVCEKLKLDSCAGYTPLCGR